MDFAQQRQQVTAYTTEEIYWHLSNNADHFGKDGQLALCDELLVRKERIKHIGQHFERMVRGLSTRKLEFINAADHLFSKATVHVVIQELERRNKPVATWFVHNGQVQSGPFPRIGVEKRIEKGDIKPDNKVWKEGWAEWRTVKSLPYLSAPLYFQQDLPGNDAQEPPRYENSQTAGGGEGIEPDFSLPAQLPPDNDGLIIATAILVFVSVPMWLFVSIVTPFSSYDEATGLVLPFAFAIYMMVSSIPFGIGLLGHKYWAWWGTLTSSAIATLWMLSKAFYYGDNGGWVVVLLIEAIIVTFLAATKRHFNTERV